MKMEKKHSAAIISLQSESSKRTFDAMNDYFKVVDDIQLRDIEIVLGPAQAQPLYRGEPMRKYDCVYIKGSFRYASVAKSVAALLQNKCYMPTHNSAFTTVHNKLLTHLALQQHDIPMPKTYIVSTNVAGKKLLKNITYPIIIKIPEGTQGKGVMFADSFAAASSLFDTLQSLKQPFIIQEYIETGGEDIRAIVVGDRVVAAMKRRAVVGEVRANFHAGGAVEAFSVDPATRKLCVKIAKVLQTDICGVDILEGPKGPVVIEVNLSPGLQGIMQATNRNIADDIAAHLFNQTDLLVSARSKGNSSEHILSTMGINTLDASSDDDHTQRIITPLDFRARRVLLPEIVTTLGKIKEDQEYVVEISPNNINIKKM